MSIFRFLGIALVLFLGFVGGRLLLAPQPLKPDARLPTFREVSANDARVRYDSSNASDNDAVRDRLRQSVQTAAGDLSRDACNAAVKARYVEAATNYARAWLSIAPCVGTGSCGSSDERKLDRAQQAFGTPLDNRVRAAMAKVHDMGIIAVGDFPKDAVGLVAEMAGDPVINPRAAARFKTVAQEMRSPPACRVSLH